MKEANKFNIIVHLPFKADDMDSLQIYYKLEETDYIEIELLAEYMNGNRPQSSPFLLKIWKNDRDYCILKYDILECIAHNEFVIIETKLYIKNTALHVRGWIISILVPTYYVMKIEKDENSESGYKVSQTIIQEEIIDKITGKIELVQRIAISNTLTFFVFECEDIEVAKERAIRYNATFRLSFADIYQSHCSQEIE